MDNDNFLRRMGHRAKSALFGLKYRGVPILDAEQGNGLIAQSIRWGKPFYAGRCGATEMRAAAEWLHDRSECRFSSATRAELRNLSGVFPTDDDTLRRFCEFYCAAAQQADILALWDVGAERTVIRGCKPATQFTQLRALEPYYHEKPWSAELAGKRVLVVHPFAESILAQYAHRETLFPGKSILPQFASLQVIRAVQGLAGEQPDFPSWFAALSAMQAQMDAAEYDIAITGAGAYSLPLAAHAKATGHMAVQMSGATQLLFGIKGKRWDTHPVISGLYNSAWVRPAKGECLSHPERVEGGSYW